MDLILPKQRRDEELELKKKMYETIAMAALKYGSAAGVGFTNDQIYEFWKYDCKCPSRVAFRDQIKIRDVRKVIQSAIKVDHGIWNADFLHGLAVNCVVSSPRISLFKSMKWRSNKEIQKIVLVSPFGGTFGKNFQDNDPLSYDHWSYVPALDLSYTPYSLSYVAGLLSAGKIVFKDGQHFSKHSDDAIAEIKKLHIPIEKEVSEIKGKGINHYVLISPIWGALFSIKMPKEVREKWFNLKNASNTHLYSAILWRTYVDSRFKRAGIPYLKSKRMIFYEYKCEEGAMTKLENLRFDLKLTQLEYVIRDIV